MKRTRNRAQPGATRISSERAAALREQANQKGHPIQLAYPAIADMMAAAPNHVRFKVVDKVFHIFPHPNVSGKFAAHEIRKRPWLNVWMFIRPQAKVQVGYREVGKAVPVIVDGKVEFHGNAVQNWVWRDDKTRPNTGWRQDLDDIEARTPAECKEWLRSKGIEQPIHRIIKTSESEDRASFHVVFSGGKGDWTYERRLGVCNQVSGLAVGIHDERPSIKAANGVDYDASLGDEVFRVPFTYNSKARSWITEHLEGDANARPVFADTTVKTTADRLPSEKLPPVTYDCIPVDEGRTAPYQETRPEVVHSVQPVVADIAKREPPVWTREVEKVMLCESNQRIGATFRRLIRHLSDHTVGLVLGTERISQRWCEEHLQIPQHKVSIYLATLTERKIINLVDDYVPRKKARTYQFHVDFFAKIADLIPGRIPRFAETNEDGQYDESFEGMKNDAIAGYISGWSIEDTTDYVYERCAVTAEGNVRRTRPDVEGLVSWIYSKYEGGEWKRPSRKMEFVAKLAIDVFSLEYGHLAPLSWQRQVVSILDVAMSCDGDETVGDLVEAFLATRSARNGGAA